MLSKLIRCLKLNARVLQLASSRRWLSPDDVAAGYDKVAQFYDQTWLQYLQPTTTLLINELPAEIDGPIVDLGCGTGFTTEQLLVRYPDSAITGVDISWEMLSQAHSRLNPPLKNVNLSYSPSLRRMGQGGNIHFVQQDMLTYLKSLPDCHTGLIFAGWSIGYSNPNEIFHASHTKLKQNGYLAFIVNYIDTLEPVFYAYRVCMAEYPQHVERAAWLRFPKDAPGLKTMLARNGFDIESFDEGYKDIDVDWSNIDIADWLFHTGILAGFDMMLPLQKHPEVMARFRELLTQNNAPLLHHYVMVVARNTSR